VVPVKIVINGDGQCYIFVDGSILLPTKGNNSMTIDKKMLDSSVTV